MKANKKERNFINPSPIRFNAKRSKNICIDFGALAYRLTVVDTTPEGIKIAKNHETDCILVDVALVQPVNKACIVTQLQEAMTNDAPPVIVLVHSSSAAANVLTMLESGASDFLDLSILTPIRLSRRFRMPSKENTWKMSFEKKTRK